MTTIPKFNFSETEINELRLLSIKALVLFGSQAQGLATPNSDFDFGLIVGNNMILNSENKKKEIYDRLYEMLSDKVKQLTDIDIVFLEIASAELQAHVMKYGKPIFEDSPNTFFNFKARVMEDYADFAPLRGIFHQGIFSRIK